MSKQSYIYEIFLGSPKLTAEDWQKFCRHIAKLLSPFACPKLSVYLEEQTFHFYLLTYQLLPASIGLTNFLLKLGDISKFSTSLSTTRGVFLGSREKGILEIANRMKRKSCRLISLEMSLHTKLPALSSATISYSSPVKAHRRRLVLPNLFQLLAVDFNRFPNYCYKKFPKYLSSEKVLPFLTESYSSSTSLLKVDTFPFDSVRCNLNIDNFDFAKHSLVLGSSGSGKSCFLSLLIDRIYQNYPEQYKIIVIDPHDALYRDLTSIVNQSYINFSSPAQSLDLFQNPVENVGVAVELLLEIFQDLMKDNYNSRLERVLRFSSQLLLLHQNFSFVQLRKLLLDASYRNQLLSLPGLPTNVAEFFLTDFNMLKTQSYDLAIAPIIAFLDTAQTVPALFSEQKLPDFSEIVTQNFLSIFSLNQLRLGQKMTRTIAGLLMQQIFLLSKSEKLSQDLIIIIDEVAVIEQPILQNFLSELRKYHVSVILAGQYLAQMTSGLRAAIFANVTNYFLFRLSRNDANLVVENLDLTLKHGDTIEGAKFLSGLNPRECVSRLSFGEKLRPAFKAKTFDFTPPPYIPPSFPSAEDKNPDQVETITFDFDLKTNSSIDQLMRENTTKRKKLQGEDL